MELNIHAVYTLNVYVSVFLLFLRNKEEILPKGQNWLIKNEKFIENRNRLTDLENRFMATSGGKMRGRES